MSAPPFLCPENLRQNKPRAYVVSIDRLLRMSSLQCTNETDRARVSLAIARLPSKVSSLRKAVDRAGGAPLRSNCMPI